MGSGWTVPTPEEADGPTVGDDRAILEGYLGFQRTTLLNICAGLTAEQLAVRPLPSTSLSLQGIVRHLAKVERIWLTRRAAGLDTPDLYGGPGDPADFRDTDPAHAPAEVEQLRRECAAGDAAVASLPFDTVVEWRSRQASADSEPETWSLRMIYVHLIGEYARHNGHADLLREAIDGTTGR